MREFDSEAPESTTDSDTEILPLPESHSSYPAYGLVGKSKAMQQIYEVIDKIKDSSVNVLILGQSGTGKEMVASAIHRSSPRRDHSIVAINCSAIPDALLEGELFGYKRGAFTDARADKMGLFQQAHQGTLFLDEIGDMPLTVQPKILRAIQEKEIRPLGSLETIKVDVRIIAATHQDLKAKMDNKTFRDDLFYRLNTIKIEIPPLKDHAEDIPMLADFFLEEIRKKNHCEVHGISRKAMQLLMQHSWPGNIRELENVLERAALLSKAGGIQPQDLLFTSEDKIPLPTTDWVRSRKKLEEVEKEYILAVLQETHGNRSETALILGIGRKTLYNKLARYGIH